MRSRWFRMCGRILRLSRFFEDHENLEFPGTPEFLTCPVFPDFMIFRNFWEPLIFSNVPFFPILIFFEKITSAAECLKIQFFEYHIFPRLLAPIFQTSRFFPNFRYPRSWSRTQGRSLWCSCGGYPHLPNWGGGGGTNPGPWTIIYIYIYICMCVLSMHGIQTTSSLRSRWDACTVVYFEKVMACMRLAQAWSNRTW